MKLITRDTDYGIRALCYIYKHKKKIVPVTEMVSELSIPRPFLRKILQALNKKGILRSYKGQGGGFLAVKSAREIILVDLIKIFQGSLSLNECFLKKIACPNIHSCVLKRKLDKLQQTILRNLKSITLASLLR